MEIRPIRTHAGHKAALARIEALWDAKPRTPEHDELEVLGVLVAAYEEQRWPILPPEPVAAIRFHMEQNGLRNRDFAAVLGSESRASEILNRRRPLTVQMIRAIHDAWSIPLESLIGRDARAA
jgi:HTH-type transcriptional regulator / antitoxin HigA